MATVVYPQQRPNPWAEFSVGLSEGLSGLMQGINQFREQQNLPDDLAALHRARTDPNADWSQVYKGLKTRTGRLLAMKMEQEMAPVPVYGQEGGKLTYQGQIPGGARIMQPDPLQRTLLHEQMVTDRQEKTLAAQDKRAQERQDLADKRLAFQEKMGAQRFDLQNRLWDKRLSYQEKLQGMKDAAANQKDIRKTGRQIQQDYMKDRIQLDRNRQSALRNVPQMAATDSEQQKLRDDVQAHYDEQMKMLDEYYGKSLSDYGLNLPKIGGKAASPSPKTITLDHEPTPEEAAALLKKMGIQ